MENMDMRLLIKEVRKRPTLWDSSSEHYKNRLLKKEDWLEVCEIVCAAKGKTKEEKIQISKYVQLKWKNLRDAFVRYIRLSASEKSGGGKTLKTYVYAKQLDFLMKVVEYRPKHNNMSHDQHHVDVDQSVSLQGDSEPEDPLQDTYSIAPSGTSSCQSKRSLEDYLTSSMDIRKNVQLNQEENDDMAFFRSLRPMLETLLPKEKLLFRIEVMKLLQQHM